jgi:hypothetical protein
MIRIILSTFLIIFLAFTGFSQTINTNNKSEILQKLSSTPILNLNPPDLTAIKIEDSINDKAGKLYRIGVAIPTSINTSNHGKWTTNEFGERIWQLQIKVSGAEALSFPFEKFYLYDKATIDIFDNNGKRLHSTYTAAEVLSHGQQNLALCFGDDMTIQIKEPAGTRASEIQINEIMYAYRSTGNPNIITDFGDAGSCNVNVNCSPEGNNWQDEKRGIVRILVRVGATQGWGTGALMNNTALNCTPLILTSMFNGLNGATFASAADLNQWIFYFNYEAVSCANPGTNPASNTITGCVRRAYSNDGGGNTGSDFLLVQLNSSIPASYNVYYNGWDANNTATTGGVCIHHPAGDIKKISTFNGTTSSTSWGGTVANTHWQLTWSATVNGHGVTEGGSSGAPIFKNSTGQIVGTLTGGGSDCANRTAADACGKMSYHWASNGTTSATRLKDWLDPGNTGVLSLSGSSNPCSPTVASFSVSSSTVCVGQNATITDASSNATSWTWNFGSDASPATASGVGPHTVNYLASGVKTISLTVNGTTTSTQTIMVNSSPILSVNSGSICSGTSFTMTPSGALTYTYTGGSAIVSPTTTTSYTVTGTDANGCVSSAPAVSNVTVNFCAVDAAALNFDGINDRVTINNPLTNSFTLETYIKTSTPSATGTNAWQGSGILDGDVPGAANDFILSVLNNRIAFWDGSSNINVVSTTTVTDGTWKHVALTRAAGGQIKLYINGVLEASGTAGLATLNTNPVIYFGNNFNAGTFTNISIDETRIWNRALCQAEIQNNMNGELLPGQFGLLSYYKYNQGVAASSNATVTTLNDASGNANNGTLSNFALTGTTSNWIAPGAIANGINAITFISPTVSIMGTNAICLGESTTFTASGNVTNYNWVSGPATATNLVTPTLTTTYSVVGTNSLGCQSNIATKTLSVNALPSVTSSVTNVSCNGGTNGTATLTATGGTSPYTYLASTGATVSTFSSLAPGAYSYTVTDANSCAKAQTFTVTQPTAISTTSAVTNALCNAGTGSATVTATGGTGAYTYLASNGATVSTQSGLMAGTYNYTVTDANACTKTQALSITEPTAIVTTSAVTNALCNGAAGSATVTATGGTGAYTYLASNGATVSAQSGLVAGTYNYTVTDANACTKTQALSITEPTAIVTTSAVTNALCNGGTGSATVTATGGTTPYSYLASNGATVSVQSGLMAGTYNYTVTDANACEQTQILSITEPTAINLSASASNATICAGASSTLTANATGGTGTLTYTWVSGPTSNVNTVTPTATAVYTVDVTDANNCAATSTVEVTVNSLPTISVNSGSICAGQSFTMVPTGATTYTYSNGTDVVTPSANDSYTVTGTDANGCVSVTGAVSTVTVNALPVLTAVTNNTLLCVGQTATLSVSGATTYTWSTTENTTDIAVSPTVQTTYTVNGTDANGCSNNTTVTQDVSACTGIATLTNDTSINVYPNPNNGLFVIELTTESKVTVINALGQVVIAETFEAGKHTVNINNESTGVYFVKVMTNNKQQIIKVIKE